MPPSAIGVLGVDPTRVDTTQQHELGLRLDFSDGSERRYIQAGANIAQYDVLTSDVAEGINQVLPTSAGSQSLAGVAPLAILENRYGWIVTKGNVTAKSLVGLTAGDTLGSDVGGVFTNVSPSVQVASGVGALLVTPDSPSAGLSLVLLT